MTQANEEYLKAVNRASEFAQPEYISCCDTVIESLHQRISDILKSMLNDTDDLDEPG